MKKFLPIAVAILFTTPAFAQSSFSNTGSGLNDLSGYMDDSVAAGPITPTVSNDARVFESITLDATDSLLRFSNLPQKMRIALRITDAYGQELVARMVNDKRATLGVKNLPHDLLYITLLHGTRRKTFMLDRSVKAEARPTSKKKQDA